MYRFGAFTLDPERYELLRDGLLVHVEPQVFDLLCFLIEHRDRVVGKDEILVAVWGDRFVSESALTSRIKSARRAVGDSGDTQHLIRTARQRGYQFVAVVSTIDRPATQQTPGIESASQGAAVPAGMKPSTSAFRIQLLGSFGVASDGLPDDTRQWRLRKAKALVAMLALAPGQRRHREYVLDRLWPDLEPLAAAKNLHQTLYVARHAITGAEVLPSGLLSICDDHVVLEETGPVDVDVLRFERAAANALKSCVEAELRGADALYGGDLLPDWVDSDWLTDRRHALRETHREISVKLAETLLSHAPDEALLILTRVLESSPVHEGAVRAQMRVLARMGRRSEALARYENLVDDLLEAFGTDPDGQTVALFRQLLTGAPAAPAFPRAPSGGAEAGIGYLPAPLTSFIGRERELDDVERLMSHARLLTLTGAGGSGKTRLALEVGRTAAADYPDGVWFVDLSTVGESLLVADAVAETLRLDSGAAPNRQKALVDSLRSRTLLIVLDNCEHLLAACRELVTSVLAGCPEVNVLATSREPLHAHGEYTFRVPSLALPSPSSHTIPDLHEIGDLSSVRLFVERATQVRPDFTLDSSNVEGVIEVCRQLDGMPLPLELAAARTTVLEPTEILRRLSDVLSMLDGGRDGITRRQTLRGTLEWSHDLLTEPERILLRRLSVFSGGFTLEALETTCGEPPLEQTVQFDLLAGLVDKSMVVPERTPAGTRYRQLETVRQFSGEKLDLAGETGQLSAAHCAYFLSLALAHNPELAKGVVIEQPKVLDREHDNLRAALRWACTADPESALLLAASLWRYWFLRGHAVEGARWIERALVVAPGATRPRAAALIGLTGLDSRQGRSDRHRSSGMEATAIMRQIGEPDEVLMAQIVEAMLAWCLFDLDEAEQMASDARSQALAQGRPEHAAAGSWILGHCALSRENGILAAQRLESCLQELASCDVRKPPFLPVITPAIQLVSISGRLVPYLEETMLLGRRVGVAQATGYALSSLGHVSRLRGDLTSAGSVVTEAVERFTELGDDLGTAQALNQLGCIHRDGGNYGEAEQALSLAQELRLRIGDRRGELLTEINTALLFAMAGDTDRGLDSARRSLSGFESAGDQVGIGATLSILAAIELRCGETRASREMYAQAADRFAPWPRLLGWLRLMVAELSNELGDPRRTDREIASAAKIFDSARCVIAGGRLAALRGMSDEGGRISPSR